MSSYLVSKATYSIEGWKRIASHENALQGLVQRRLQKQVPKQKDGMSNSIYTRTLSSHLKLIPKIFLPRYIWSIAVKESDLDPIYTLKWPFTMVFDRRITKSFSLFLSINHTIVSAITLAIPLFPPQIKRLLHVPWTINRNTIRRKFAMWKASFPYTSSFFTLSYTNSETKIDSVKPFQQHT